MRFSLTDKILLFFADYSDFYHASFSIKNVLHFTSGDPILHSKHIWMKKYIENKKTRKKLFDTMYGMYKRNLLRKIISKKSSGYIISPKGQQKVFCIQCKNLGKKKLAHGEWLMVFFDIPETKRSVRNMLRRYLKILGFDQLQKSIWVSSYDVSHEVNKVVDRYRIMKNVYILKVKNFSKNYTMEINDRPFS